MRRAVNISLCLLVPTLLIARGAEADHPVHEYVPDLSSDEGTLLVSAGGEQPGAIIYQGEVLPAPPADRLQPGEQALRAGRGDGAEREEPGRRSPTFRPDRVTELNGTVGYYTVFTPTIAPFKRVTALDTVTLARDGTPVLSIARPTRVSMPVAGLHSPPPDPRPRDRFWGSVVLDFSEGPDVPFPGVSPESRILTVETTPRVNISFSRDGADNVIASSPSSREREVRVVFLMDAPRTYFGGSIASGPVGALANEVPPLPADLQREAEMFAAELGLSRQSTFRAAMNELTRHFRSFEESRDPPRNTGNIYLDLSRGLRGICRHRAYGFAITAQALGMHARFVQNEAHAWIEVEQPGERGWLRVDLGGAATGLEARGAQNRPVYRAPMQDRLPRPPAYERAYEEARQMSGLRRQPTSGGGGSGGDSDGGSSDSSGENGAVGGSDDNTTAGTANEGPADGTELRAQPATGGRATGGRATGGRATGGTSVPVLEVRVDRRRFEVFRGRELEVTGSLRGGGEGVEGLRVEVLLSAQRGDAERLLGVTVSRENGRYRGVFGIPPDLPVGDYRLLVRTPGGDGWLPASAR